MDDHVEVRNGFHYYGRQIRKDDFEKVIKAQNTLKQIIYPGFSNKTIHDNQEYVELTYIMVRDEVKQAIDVIKRFMDIN